MSAGIAAAIAAPAFHSVNATPRAVIHDFHKMLGGMFFKKFAVVGQLRDLLSFDFVQCEAERHFAIMMMMAVAFPVGGDVDELRSLAGIGEAAHQPIGETFAIVQQSLESHALRNGTVVKE